MMRAGSIFSHNASFLVGHFRSSIFRYVIFRVLCELFVHYRKLGLFSVVQMVSTTAAGGIVHDKLHACYFCQKMVTNIWRHYEHVHPKEPHVEKILALPKDDIHRNKEITRLRLSGDYYHNLNVLQTKSGNLVVVRRPKDVVVDYSDFLPCTGCRGFFLRKELWRHCRSCEFVESGQEIKCQKDGQLLITPVLYSAASVSPALSEVLGAMKRDEVSLVVKNDPLILSFGNLLAHGQASSNTSERMRQLAKLVLQLRKATESSDGDLASFLKPENFDSVVKAVLVESKYEESTATATARLKTPSLALKIGHSVRKCCNLLVNKALREKDKVLEHDAMSFLRVFDSEWQYKVSRLALKTLKDDQRNKPDLIPITSDLVKLKTYLQQSARECSEALNSIPNVGNYMNLVDVILSRIILFNKRRGGETGRMLISSYQQCGLTPQSGLNDIEKTLSSTEQKLCSRMKLVQISGKRNRTVPVLLTADVTKGIDCILSNREKVGVEKDNVFVFARTSGLNSVDACECLRRVAANAGVERPDLIRSTMLRKYIATVSQVLDMTENELDLLCKHMGHSVNVHHSFYRLPSQTLELAKISKLLLAVESGNLGNLAGKKFEDIDVDDIPGDHESDGESAETDCDDDVAGRNEGRVDDTVERQTDKGMAVGVEQIKNGESTHVNGSDSGTLHSSHQHSMDTTSCYQRKDASRRVKKRPWSADEKNAVFQHLDACIKKGLVPSKKQCLEAIEKSDGILANRSWQHVKFAVKNILSASRRLLSE